MELSEVHNCEKCQGKIVLIEVDSFGNTHCGYCHSIVDYKQCHKNIYKDKILPFNIHKEDSKKWQKQKKKKRKRKVVQKATLLLL